MKRCSVVFGLFVFSCMQGVGFGGEWLNRLRKEAPSAWAEYSKKVSEFNQYEVRHSMSNSTGRKTRIVTRFKRSQMHDKFITEMLTDCNRNGQDASLKLLRKDWACELYKRRMDGPWLIRTLHWDVHEQAERYWKWLEIGPEWRIVVPTVEIIAAGNTPIGEIIADGDIKIEQCAPRPDQSDRVIVVLRSTRAALVSGREARKPADYNLQASLELDPSRGWVILRGEIGQETLESKSHRSFYLQTTDLDGLSLPTKYVLTGETIDKATGSKITGVVTREYRFVRDSPPDEEFELTYYGIPAAIAARPAGGPKTWQWLALAGAVLLAVGVGIYWWLGRRQAAASR